MCWNAKQEAIECKNREINAAKQKKKQHDHKEKSGLEG